MNNQKKVNFAVSGQTLIETLAALFILVMGVTAATGLAIYSFNASTSINKQIVATGLAREGVEAIKNMRDTNWLKIGSPDTNCYNYASSTAYNAKCYKSWLDPSGSIGYDITGTGVKSLRLSLNPSINDSIWTIKSDDGNWGLNFDSNMSGGVFNGFYTIPNISSGLTHGSSGFYRQIVLTEDTSGNYSWAEYHRLIVESRVWWIDKRCPKSAIWPGLGKCSISLVTNLTNWKNYQLTQ